MKQRSAIGPIPASSPSCCRAAAPVILIFAAALLLQPPACAEKIDQLKPQGYVNDFAGVIDTQATTQLTRLCTELDQKAHAQIAVVTIRTLEGVPTEDFANKLFERWGIGPKSDNRGVLILLAAGDHKYRVEVGYGLEPILPDGKVGGFGREMVPLLRQGDYSAALLQLTNQIAAVIAADRGVTLTSASSERPPPRRQRGSAPLGLLLLIAALVIFGGIGGGGAFLAWLLFGRGYQRPYGNRWGGPWVGGGGPWSGGGFGGSSGGGFGGFGGGSSGGGGASGSW